LKGLIYLNFYCLLNSFRSIVNGDSPFLTIYYHFSPTRIDLSSSKKHPYFNSMQSLSAYRITEPRIVTTKGGK